MTHRTSRPRSCMHSSAPYGSTTPSTSPLACDATPATRPVPSGLHDQARHPTDGLPTDLLARRNSYEALGPIVLVKLAGAEVEALRFLTEAR